MGRNIPGPRANPGERLNLVDAAEWLDLDPSEVVALTRRGAIRFETSPGGVVLIREGEIIRYITEVVLRF